MRQYTAAHLFGTMWWVSLKSGFICSCPKPDSTSNLVQPAQLCYPLENVHTRERDIGTGENAFGMCAQRKRKEKNHEESWVPALVQHTLRRTRVIAGTLGWRLWKVTFTDRWALITSDHSCVMHTSSVLSSCMGFHIINIQGNPTSIRE